MKFRVNFLILDFTGSFLIEAENKKEAKKKFLDWVYVETLATEEEFKKIEVVKNDEVN